MAAAKQKTSAAAQQQQGPVNLEAAIETSVRVFTDWTPERLRIAERSADVGSLWYASNICEWLLTDDRIRGVLSARIGALLGLVPSFEKSGDRRRSNRAIKALEADEDWWVSYPESELWQMIAWGLLLGVAPLRHNWTTMEGHGNRVLPCPKFWHPQNLRFDWQSRQWFMRVQYGTALNGYVDEPVNAGDGAWILHTPFGSNRPWALGLWRGLAWWKLLKEMARGDWAQHSEKASLLVITSDVATGKPVPGTAQGFSGNPDSRAMRQDLADSIYARGREAIAVLPPRHSMELVESVANTKNLYQAQVEMANEAFAITIRGGNLTTNVATTSSSAAAEVQERTGDFVNLRFDAETSSTTIWSQSLPWWAEFNFGDKGLAPWPNYPIAPQRNLTTFAGAVTAAVNALDRAEQIGLEVDRQAFLEEFEFQDFMKPGKRPKIMVPIKPPKPMGEGAAAADPAAEPDATQGDAPTPGESSQEAVKPTEKQQT